MSKSINDAKTAPPPVDSKSQSQSQSQEFHPPPYAPPRNLVIGRPQHRPHSNAVIEAGHVRARDEVCLLSSMDVIIRYALFNVFFGAFCFIL